MKHKNLYWGVFFILAAAIVILNEMGFLGGMNVFSLMITLLLVPLIIKSIRYLSFSGVLFPLAIIGILYAEPLGIENLTPWPILGVALFLSIGLSFIFPQSFKKWKNSFSKDHYDEEWIEENIDEGNKDSIYIETKFAGSVKYINTDNFKKANIHCSFGGMKVYFDHADIQQEEASIYIDVKFGGLELFIPREWKIIDQVNCSFGDIEEKNHPQTKENAKTVKLIGKVEFSGVTIVYI